MKIPADLRGIWFISNLYGREKHSCEHIDEVKLIPEDGLKQMLGCISARFFDFSK